MSDPLVLSLLVLAAAVAVLTHTPQVTQAFSALTISTLAAAVIMLATAAWMGHSDEAARLSTALAVYAAVLLPLRDAELGIGGRGGGLMLVAVILGGFAGIVHISRHPHMVGGHFAVTTVVVLAMVLAAVGTTVIGTVPAAAAATLLVAACIATTMVAADHLRGDNALHRRVGLALVVFAVAAAAQAGSMTPIAPVLDLAGAGLLLWASVGCWAMAFRALWKGPSMTLAAPVETAVAPGTRTGSARLTPPSTRSSSGG